MTNKITITEIAKQAKTSKTTVSFYLNGKTDKMSEETKKRIQKVIEETNYRPSVAARTLNSKSSRLIGVLIGDITNSFSNQLVKGIEDCARKEKYQLMVGNSGYRYKTEEKYVERMLATGVEGFIVQPSVKFQPLVERIKSVGGKVVFVDSQSNLLDEQWVKTDHHDVLAKVGDILYDKGYDEFLMITADPEVLQTRKERTEGFLSFVKSKNKTCNTIVVDDEHTVEDIRREVEQHIVPGRHTLVFVANCFLLPNVYMALKPYRSLMPDTVGLLGYDNIEWTELASPTVTTIVQPAYNEGVNAMKILLDSINGNEEIQQQMLECSVNWQESTM